MAFVYLAPLKNGLAFKVGKAIAPSSRLSQLGRFYEFDEEKILIVNCENENGAFSLESILHKACEGNRVLMPYDGGTEFFSQDYFQEAQDIARSVSRINGHKIVPFVRERQRSEIDEAELIVASFSKKIRARRLDLNLSPQDLANLANISKRTVERIESRGQTTFYHLVSVLRQLDLDYLFAELELDIPFRQRASGTRSRK